MRLTRRLFAAAAALALLAAPAAALAVPAASWEPYDVKLRDGSILQVDKGTIRVPEDRTDPSSRRIPLGFLRLKSASPNPGAPIVYLAGGPGGSGSGTLRGPRQPVFLALREVADVIVLDQRGTGLSDSIEPCKAATPFDVAGQTLSEATWTAYNRATLDRCLPVWKGQGVAIGGYTTAQSAEDIEDLRRALGVPRLSLWGISYGTHLGLAYMRAHPGSVDRVAFASVEGMSQTVKLPARLDKAMERIGAHVGRPDLPDVMRRVHARLDARPQALPFRRADGSTGTLTADSFGLRMVASFVPKNPDGIPMLVQLYDALDAGVYAPAGQILYDYVVKDPLELGGMAEAMDIASGVSPARLALIDRQAPASTLGRAANHPMPQLAGAIPGIDLGEAFRREITSDIPVLVFSGDLDLRTPLEEQTEALAGLTRRQQVLFRNGGHDLFEAHPDVADILKAWFSGRPVTVKELVLPAAGG